MILIFKFGAFFRWFLVNVFSYKKNHHTWEMWKGWVSLYINLYIQTNESVGTMYSLKTKYRLIFCTYLLLYMSDRCKFHIWITHRINERFWSIRDFLRYHTCAEMMNGVLFERKNTHKQWSYQLRPNDTNSSGPFCSAIMFCVYFRLWCLLMLHWSWHCVRGL